MRNLAIVLAIGVAPCLMAQPRIDLTTAPVERQLTGLNPQDAASLLGKITEAQQQLRAGRHASFELLSGVMASDEKTKISPQEIFLGLPMAKVWSIESIKSDSLSLRLYRLAYAPEGLGKLFWQIDVVLFDGTIQRVSLLYKVPPPF